VLGPKNNNNFTKIIPKKSPKEKRKEKTEPCDKLRIQTQQQHFK
jgi:hypothetical protein